MLNWYILITLILQEHGKYAENKSTSHFIMLMLSHTNIKKPRKQDFAYALQVHCSTMWSSWSFFVHWMTFTEGESQGVL